MKLSKTTALVLCAFSGSLAFAAEPASNVALYGVLDTGVYAHHASNGKTIVEMASGITKGSRFGLEGQENLGNGYKVYFRLEQGFESDNGDAKDADSAFYRDSYMGVATPFGAFELGRTGALTPRAPPRSGGGELVHYLGDSVALVCAVDQETVEAAKKLVKVEYEVLPAVHDPTEAAAPGAPLVFDEEKSNVQAYKHVSRGDAEGAIKNAKYVLTEHFSTPWTEHAFLEPECCVALPLDNGGVKLLTTDQSAHTTMHECAAMLGVDYDHCQVQNCLVGGGFGGKEDMSVQHHAALLCYLTKRPVKFKLSRQESILVHPKRHSMDMDFTMGCDENGIIQGVTDTSLAPRGTATRAQVATIFMRYCQKFA